MRFVKKKKSGASQPVSCYLIMHVIVLWVSLLLFVIFFFCIEPVKEKSIKISPGSRLRPLYSSAPVIGNDTNLSQLFAIHHYDAVVGFVCVFFFFEVVTARAKILRDDGLSLKVVPDDMTFVAEPIWLSWGEVEWLGRINPACASSLSSPLWLACWVGPSEMHSWLYTWDSLMVCT